jgi:hypothetical protein
MLEIERTDNNLEWVYDKESDTYFCPNCLTNAYTDTVFGQQLFDFCPYCGAFLRRYFK